MDALQGGRFGAKLFGSASRLLWAATAAAAGAAGTSAAKRASVRRTALNMALSAAVLAIPGLWLEFRTANGHREAAEGSCRVSHRV